MLFEAYRNWWGHSKPFCSITEGGGDSDGGNGEHELHDCEVEKLVEGVAKAGEGTDESLCLLYRRLLCALLSIL